MTEKKERKFEKPELKNLAYPMLFSVVIFISLLIFGLSLRFIFKSISGILLFNPQTIYVAPTRFQIENLTPLKRYLPDLPKQK